jgi:hypothetical protein
MTILPLRRMYIEHAVQPEMLAFTSTEEVVALFKMCVHHSLFPPCSPRLTLRQIF